MNFDYLDSNFGDDHTFIREILENIVPDIDTKLSEIRICLAQNDSENCHRVIHNIKSAIEMLGLEGMLATLKEIDQHAKNREDLRPYESIVISMENKWKSIRKEILDHYK